MKHYEIRTTGIGTKKEIISSLKALVKSLESSKDIDRKTFEDKTLATETFERIV